MFNTVTQLYLWVAHEDIKWLSYHEQFNEPRQERIFLARIYRSRLYKTKQNNLLSLLNHLEQLKQDRLLQYEKTVVKLGMRRLNSEGKKTILGADMETQTPFLELETAPKQTMPTNQEAHYFTVQMHAK